MQDCLTSEQRGYIIAQRLQEMVDKYEKDTSTPSEESGDTEAGEEQLAILIHEAGEEVRRKNRQVMAEHYRKIQHAIEQGMSWRKERKNEETP